MNDLSSSFAQRVRRTRSNFSFKTKVVSSIFGGGGGGGGSKQRVRVSGSHAPGSHGSVLAAVGVAAGTDGSTGVKAGTLLTPIALTSLRTSQLQHADVRPSRPHEWPLV